MLYVLVGGYSASGRPTNCYDSGLLGSHEFIFFLPYISPSTRAAFSTFELLFFQFIFASLKSFLSKVVYFYVFFVDVRERCIHLTKISLLFLCNSPAVDNNAHDGEVNDLTSGLTCGFTVGLQR